MTAVAALHLVDAPDPAPRFHCGQQVSVRAVRDAGGLLGWQLAEIVTYRMIGELQQLTVRLADQSLLTVAGCHCRPLTSPGLRGAA